MEFAVNYSPPLAGLVESAQVAVDRYKCPDWPDLLAEARLTRPVYVHFPLTIGGGGGYALDSDRKRPADLERVADLLAQTGTPYVNTHFAAPLSGFPGMAVDSRAPADRQRVLAAALRDLEPLMRRFGPENVLVENLINEYGGADLCALPETINTLLEQTGCGFLFDLSHARLAAASLGFDPRAYIQSLPVAKMREMHVTGLQVLEGPLLERMFAIGDPYKFAERMAGKRIDHLAMVEDDWPELEWALGEIRAGRWGRPWVVAYEYGGVGAFWEEVTETQVYLDQLPRMREMIGDSK